MRVERAKSLALICAFSSVRRKAKPSYYPSSHFDSSFGLETLLLRPHRKLNLQSPRSCAESKSPREPIQGATKQQRQVLLHIQQLFDLDKVEMCPRRQANIDHITISRLRTRLWPSLLSATPPPRSSPPSIWASYPHRSPSDLSAFRYWPQRLSDADQHRPPRPRATCGSYRLQLGLPDLQSFSVSHDSERAGHFVRLPRRLAQQR